MAAADSTTFSEPPVPEFAFEIIVESGPMQELGPSVAGQRRVSPIAGGRFEGPRLRGTVLPGGSDRQLVRPDGVLQIRACYDLRTEDGVVVTVEDSALLDFSAEGEPYRFSSISLTAPEGPYGWLNRRVFVGTLDTMDGGVRIGVYALA